MTTTEQKWSTRVSAWRTSGMTAREFSTGRGFSAGALRHWACMLKKREMQPQMTPPPAPALVRVARVDRSPARQADPATALVIEVGAARLRVPAGFDAATVRLVIAALLEPTTDSGAR